jgi:hypothetical protein
MKRQLLRIAVAAGLATSVIGISTANTAVAETPAAETSAVYHCVEYLARQGYNTGPAAAQACDYGAVGPIGEYPCRAALQNLGVSGYDAAIACDLANSG